MALNISRRALVASFAAVLLAACANAPSLEANQARATLAPTGTLRIAVYPGSPTSMLLTPGSPEMRGMAVDIGRELARRLGVPAEIIVLQRVAEVVEALKAGRADLTVTNATEARARELDFTAPLISLELGYAVLPGSPVTSIDAVDRPGLRIGVSQGSSSQAALSREFKQARLVAAVSLQAAAAMLKAGEIDAFATNKAILFEMADNVPGARVLDGRWGLEHLAIAVPQGRGAGLPYLQRLAQAMGNEGLVTRAAQRAGLRGTVEAPPR